jgi:hypothetical protein
MTTTKHPNVARLIELWVKVPLRLYEAEWTTPYTIAVYGAIASYADFKNAKVGAHPSLEQIAARSKVSRRQVVRELQRMAKHGCITWDKGHSGRGSRIANSYVLNWAPGEHSGGQSKVPGRHYDSAREALRIVPGGHSTENHVTENHNREGQRGALSSRGHRHIEKDAEPVWTGKPDEKPSQTPSSGLMASDF